MVAEVRSQIATEAIDKERAKRLTPALQRQKKKAAALVIKQERAYAQYVQAKKAANKAGQKLRDISNTGTNLSARVKKSRATRGGKMKRIKRIAEESTSSVQAEMLLASRKFINTTMPITIEEDSLSFYVKDIRIKDGFGGYLPLNFGNFLVSAVLVKNRVGGMVRLYTEPKGNNQLREGYCHPHVMKTGETCPGNTVNLLYESMSTGQTGLSVHLCVDFLTHYNVRSPFLTLWYGWQIHNQWDNGKCKLGGKHVLAACDCYVCPGCSKRMEPEEQKTGCGQHPHCCARNHTWYPGIAKDGRGFSGTGCINRGEPHLYPTI